MIIINKIMRNNSPMAMNAMRLKWMEINDARPVTQNRHVINDRLQRIHLIRPLKINGFRLLLFLFFFSSQAAQTWQPLCDSFVLLFSPYPLIIHSIIRVNGLHVCQLWFHGYGYGALLLGCLGMSTSTIVFVCFPFK